MLLGLCGYGTAGHRVSGHGQGRTLRLSVILSRADLLCTLRPGLRDQPGSTLALPGPQSVTLR